MKRHLLFKSLLLLCALVVGTNAWATDVTTTFASGSSYSAGMTLPCNSGGLSWVTSAKPNGFESTSLSRGIQYSKVSTDITTTIANASVTKVVVVASTNANANANSIAVYVGSSQLGSTQNMPKTNNEEYTFEVSSGSSGLSGEIKVSMSNDRTRSTYIKSIAVTYTTTGGGGGGGSTPLISADDVNIGENATSGSIEYTLNNASGNVSASITSGDWLTLGTITSSAVPFTCSANTGAQRTATVTLSFSGATDKVVTITQAAKTVAAPEYNVQSNGNYLAGMGIVLTSEGNTIYYNMTTDGSDPGTPNQSSTEYTSPIALPEGTVKFAAIAYDSYGNKSTVANRTCTGVAPATLPFSWNGGAKSTFTALTGVVGFSLGDYTDNDSNKPYLIQFNGTGDYIEIFTDEKPVKVDIDVKMIGGGSTSKITVQESTNGINFTDVEELTISGSKNDVRNLETSKSFAATTRVIKLLFTKGSNVGVGPISISAANRTITLNDACTDGSMVYGTYSCSKAFVVSDDIEVSEVSVVDGKLFVDSYSTGDVVPANTGVLVAALAGGNYDVTLSAEAGTSILDNDNMLKPSGDAGITAANMTVADTKFYRLTMHNGSEIGFWWGAENGAAFNLAANKAYLAVPNSAQLSREGLWFGDDVTAIETVKTQQADGQYFNLAGQRVAQPTKGLYIVNGHKVIIK